MRETEHPRTVGEIAAGNPSFPRVFEQFGIDYFCGGDVSLEVACAQRNIDIAEVLKRLAEAESRQSPEGAADAARMTQTELVGHIVETHHAFLRAELPRLHVIVAKVASIHGEQDTRLIEVQRAVADLANELYMHMVKEEQILFPKVRTLEGGDAAPAHYCGSIRYPIRQMVQEHDDAGGTLATLRELTDGYLAPNWACNSYRAMLDALGRLETDMHVHIHKENNILFPRAIGLEDRAFR